MASETLAKNLKKVNKWGKGLSVFVTKEAKLLGWDDKTYVSLSVVKNKDGEKIEIKKIKV